MTADPTQAWSTSQVPGLGASGQAVQGMGGATMVITLTPIPAQLSAHGVAISTLQVTAGARGTLTYAASGLPPGLSIGSANGQITGTPTTPGLYRPIVTVTDSSSGDAASAQFDWVVF